MAEKENGPKISVILPVFNGEKYIEKTITSIKEQTFKDFEVIIIDDCSNDSSKEIILAKTTDDNRFKLFKNKKRKGNAVLNKQFGLSKAKGEYYFYMSQDDLIDPNLFEVLINTSKEEGVDAVVPNMFYYGENENKTKGIFPPENNYDLKLTGKEAFKLCLRWKIHGFYLRKTGLMKKIGFDTSIFTGDEVTSRIYLYHCKKIAFVNANFYYRNDNPNAITKIIKPNILDYVTGQLKLADFMAKKSFEKKFIKKWLLETFELLKQQKQLLKESYKTSNIEYFPKEFKKALRRARNKFIQTMFILWDFDIFFDVIKYTHLRKKVKDYD